ncbi:hypothetical protein KUCAC02_010702 [Chaenocephalus aceratus]|uniref:Uncharacterized protein n=1 Tax=Chaenocephalus aceratus TaxID=36190 RepID=A0ACB9W154_CHAAC|nr:hypothetical protein KUCAC02_010702 [Chaenocephalus aceratus]
MNEHILFCKKLTGRTTGQEVFNLNAYIATGECDRAPIVKIVHTHSPKLKNEFNSYFPDIDNKSSTLDWVRNPFVTCINSSIPARLQEDLIDVSSDRSLKMRLTKLMREKQAQVSH